MKKSRVLQLLIDIITILIERDMHRTLKCKDNQMFATWYDLNMINNNSAGPGLKTNQTTYSPKLSPPLK